MNDKIGRNEPCPCGSGRKFKHCHMRTAAPAAQEAGRDSAADKGVEWLMTHHRKGAANALDQMLREALGPEGHRLLPGLQPDTVEAIHRNAAEWLLAEGRISVRGESRRVCELILGPGGARLSPAQRGWLEQLALRPLRLYVISAVEPGRLLRLADALDASQLPIEVVEEAGSQPGLVGHYVGLRALEVDGHLETSGAIYLFPLVAAANVVEPLRATWAQLQQADAAARDATVSAQIRRAWFALFNAPSAMPQPMDLATGDPIVFVTDHFSVLDRPRLEQALAAAPGVEANGSEGWVLLVRGSDGQDRADATVTPLADGSAVEVFYRTRQLAESGRAWFEALAPGAVRFERQEAVDPRAHRPAPGAPGTEDPAPPELDPQALHAAIEQAVRRTYARWPDEPLPALEGLTPRQAVAGTDNQRERVLALLRGYESAEERQAQAQRRAVISYGFLWEALGLPHAAA